MTTTLELITALYRRYPENNGKWANVVEFQQIDFLAVACWSSLGYVVHGHEIKASRSDWLRELKRPSKSYFTKRRCDYWWLVAPKGVAQEEEVPPGWGFLEWNGVSFWKVIEPQRQRVAIPRDSVLPEGGLDTHFIERQSFAMLTRRFAYAQADRDSLIAAVVNPQPYLDLAAEATGRRTSENRPRTVDWQRRIRLNSKKWKARSKDTNDDPT